MTLQVVYTGYLREENVQQNHIELLFRGYLVALC